MAHISWYSGFSPLYAIHYQPLYDEVPLVLVIATRAHTVVHPVANIILGFNNKEVNSNNNFVLKLSLNKMKAKVY